MELVKNLLSDWTGILSLGVIAVTIVIAIFFIFMFMGKSAKEE
jgi:flagellar basal body-associated protein FliL